MMGPTFERGPSSSLPSGEMVHMTPENFRKCYIHLLDVQLSAFDCKHSRASPICSGVLELLLSSQGSRAGDPRARSLEQGGAIGNLKESFET